MVCAAAACAKSELVPGMKMPRLKCAIESLVLHGIGNHQNPCYERRFWHCVRKMAACPGDDPAAVQGLCERQCANDSCIFEFDTCYNEATNDQSICPFGPGNHQNPCYEEHFWKCLVKIASCRQAPDRFSGAAGSTTAEEPQLVTSSPLVPTAGLALVVLGVTAIRAGARAMRWTSRRLRPSVCL